MIDLALRKIAALADELDAKGNVEGADALREAAYRGLVNAIAADECTRPRRTCRLAVRLLGRRSDGSGG